MECVISAGKIFYIEKESDRELLKLLLKIGYTFNSLISLEDEFGKKLKKILEKSGLNPNIVLNEVGKPLIYVTKYSDSPFLIKVEIKSEMEKVINGKKHLLKKDLTMLNDIMMEVTGVQYKDIDPENPMIMKMIESYGFSVEYTTNEALDFLINKLPEINKKYKVYVEESLKNIKPKELDINVALNTKGSLFEVKFKINGITQKDIKKVQEGLLGNKKYIRLSNDEIIDLASKKAKELKGILKELDVEEIKNQEISEFAVSKIGLINPKLKNKKLGNLKIEKLLKSLEVNKKEKYPKIEATLREYQKDGYIWMKKLYDSKLGGILADDMGLGKTIQTITLLTNIHKDNKGKSIIIAPTSLTHNWYREIEKFSPKLNAIIIEGTPKVRKQKLEEFKDGVILTSYGSFKKDIEEYENMEFLVGVLDEAQHIKNDNTLIKKAVKKLKTQARFALTGTPIENSIYELWSIFDFIIPTYLQSKEKFKNRYGEEIENNLDGSTLETLKRIVRPFILRRTKKEVLSELPDKIENNLMLELDKQQKKHYLAYLSEVKKEVKGYQDDKDFNKNRIKILALLTKLRQICCVPELIIDNYKGKNSKLEGLLELVEELKDSGHKVLIFSQFTKSFEVIKPRLDKKKITYFQLDGKTKSKNRLEMCELFNNGKKDVFLISLKAGGSGLNLTGADVVIHYDPWWNPAVELQATDRAHRIGQKKVVQVTKLISEGTIEEKILEIQERKAKLIDSMVDNKGKIEKLTKEDIL
jgi:SNF2 family DNA or RNA helicase